MEKAKKVKNKNLLTVSLGLNILFILIVLAGIYKFNFTDSDVYVDNAGTGQTVVYGGEAVIVQLDPNAPDPDAEAIAAVEAEDSQELPFDENADAAAGEDDAPPEEPATTTSRSSLPDPDNSPVETATSTEGDSEEI